MEKTDLQFYNELSNVLNIYMENWREKPLDGDEVDMLVEILRNQLNLINGNITMQEYLNKENNIEKEEKVYILLENDFDNDVPETTHGGVLGIFRNIEEARKLMEHEIRVLVENYGLVEDEDNKDKNKNKILFQGYQDNWNNYVEFEIQDYIVK